MTDLALHNPGVSELDAYMRQAEMLAASSLVPAQYRNKPADILVASLAGREVGMGPWASLTYVVVIQGKATINAEGRVALIRKAGHSISGESSPERAVAHGKRRDTGDEMTVEWTIDMAKRAGLANQNSWKNYPESMLWARAVSQLSRMLFADVLMGVSYDPEELGAHVGPEGDVIDVPTEPPAEIPEPLKNLLGDIAAFPEPNRTDLVNEIQQEVWNGEDVPLVDLPENWWPHIARLVDKRCAELAQGQGEESTASNLAEAGTDTQAAPPSGPAAARLALEGSK